MGLITKGQLVSKVQKGLKAVSNSSDDRKLKEYKQILNAYSNSLSAYETKLRTLQATEEENMNVVQVIQDLTFIKEELDGIKEHQIDDVKKWEELHYRLLRLDNMITESIKKSSQESKDEILERMDDMFQVVRDSNGKLKIALSLSLSVNLISMGGLIFAILCLLKIV